MPEEVPDEVVHVADNVDEFVERTRLKQIHEAKSAAAEALREARLDKYDRRGELRSDAAAREYAQAAVEAYILEVEALYKRTDHGQELWEEAILGRVPVVETTDFNVQDVDDVKEISTTLPLTVEGGQVVVEGVGTYVDGLQGNVQITVEVENESWDRKQTETKTYRGAMTAPIWLSREAYRATNALLAKSDMGVKIAEEEDNAEWDTSYRDDE